MCSPVTERTIAAVLDRFPRIGLFGPLHDNPNLPRWAVDDERKHERRTLLRSAAQIERLARWLKLVDPRRLRNRGPNGAKHLAESDTGLYFTEGMMLVAAVLVGHRWPTWYTGAAAPRFANRFPSRKPIFAPSFASACCAAGRN